MGAMTFNEEHRWVFPLVPTACDYAKLDEYFGKLRNAKIAALQAHGDFGNHLEARKVTKTKNRRLESKMEKSKAIVSAMKDTMQILLRKWRTIFPEFEFANNDIGRLRG